MKGYEFARTSTLKEPEEKGTGTVEMMQNRSKAQANACETHRWDGNPMRVCHRMHGRHSVGSYRTAPRSCSPPPRG
jgi:hypothetical protein